MMKPEGPGFSGVRACFTFGGSNHRLEFGWMFLLRLSPLPGRL